MEREKKTDGIKESKQMMGRGSIIIPTVVETKEEEIDRNPNFLKKCF